MTVLEHRCVSIACDGCGMELESGETDGGIHFADRQDAEQHASDCEWHLEDGKAFCPSCVEEHELEAVDKKYPKGWSARAAMIERFGTDDAHPYLDFVEYVSGYVASRFHAVKLVDQMLAEETLERVDDGVRVVLGGG